MPRYDFRILGETFNGRQFSYYSSSIVNTDVETTISASTMWNRITGSLSCSYQNQYNFDATVSNPYKTDKTFKDDIYVSSSLSGSKEFGAIIFHTLPDTNSDGVKRIKFFGTKVCNVMNIPENKWIYSHEFRLVSGSENHFFKGDIVADSLTVLNTFDIANYGSVASDLSFNIDRNTDRWIKFVDVSSSLPNNDLIIGYNDRTETYELSASSAIKFDIKGVNSLEVTHFTSSYITSSVRQITQEITSSGNSLFGDEEGDKHIFKGSIEQWFGGESNKYGLFSTASSDDARVGIGIHDPQTALEVKGDISASENIYAGGINASGPITASDNIIMSSTKKLYFNKTEDTYLDSDSTDRIRFVAGGQQMMVLDYDTGNRVAFGDTKVGIGNGDNHLPSHELEVKGAISASDAVTIGNISGNRYISASLSQLEVRSDSVSAVTAPKIKLINNGGAFLNPATSMQIIFQSSSYNVQPTSEGTATISYVPVTNQFTISNYKADGIIRFQSSGSSALMVMRHSGSKGIKTIGIGTNAPTKTLTIEGDISSSGALISKVHTFTDGDTTPDVSNGYMFKTANTGATDITGFDGGSPGQRIMILIQDNNTDFTDGTNLNLFNAANYDNGSTNDVVQFVCVDGTKWCEFSRRRNS